MKLAIANPILDLLGVPLREVVNSPGGPVQGEALILLRDVIIGTCLHPVPEDANVPGQAEKAFIIAVACATAEVVELSAEQVSFLKARAPKRWGPLIVGRLCEALDTDVGTKT